MLLAKRWGTMEAKTLQNIAFVVLIVLMFGVTTGWLGGL